MLDTSTVNQLAAYNTWADRTLYAPVARLPEGAIARQIKTLFGSILGTLNHNYQVDLIWQAHLTGSQHGFSSRRDILHADFAELARAQEAADQWLVEWADHQTPDTLSVTRQFSFTSGQPAEMQVGAMFLHVINHKTYHRGWVSQMFFDLDAKPPETDLSVFVTRG